MYFIEETCRFETKRAETLRAWTYITRTTNRFLPERCDNLYLSRYKSNDRLLSLTLVIRAYLDVCSKTRRFDHGSLHLSYTYNKKPNIERINFLIRDRLAPHLLIDYQYFSSSANRKKWNNDSPRELLINGICCRWKHARVSRIFTHPYRRHVTLDGKFWLAARRCFVRSRLRFTIERSAARWTRERASSSELLQLPVLLSESIGYIVAEAATPRCCVIVAPRETACVRTKPAT